MDCSQNDEAPTPAPEDMSHYFDGPVWNAFGLTYAAYFVIPRAVLQSMPAEWQQRLVDTMNELHDAIDYGDGNYTVLLRDDRGKFAKDPFVHYRHPQRFAGKIRKRDEPGGNER